MSTWYGLYRGNKDLIRVSTKQVKTEVIFNENRNNGYFWCRAVEVMNKFKFERSLLTGFVLVEIVVFVWWVM